MTVQVTTEPGDGGRVLAVKRATGSADVERLRHEAMVLERARHPDVVELVSFRHDENAAEMRTVFAGIHSLATFGPLTVEHAAGVVAAVAATAADLHEIGVVHGRIDAGHVLLGPSGRPVLCGFAGGGRPGSRPPLDPAPLPADADPACPPGTVLLSAVDVYGLGRLLGSLLAAPADDLEPIPDRRFVRRLRRPFTGMNRRALLTLADHATADDPRHRPTARAFAAAVRHTIPEARASAPAPRPAPVSPLEGSAASRRGAAGRRIPFGAMVAIVGGMIVVVVGIHGLRGGPVAPLVSSASGPPAAPTTTPPPSPPPTAAVVPTTIGPTCALAAGPDAADVNGDGCPEPLTIDAGVVEVAGIRYELGADGDDVAVGDWDCDGRATPALLRPRTGEVFVFPSWAEPGQDLTVTAVDRVAGGRRLVPTDGTAACPELVVERDDGTRVTVLA